MNHNTSTITGAELQTLREACGLSRDELAQLAHVQARTIKHWESGRAGVPSDVAHLVQRLEGSVVQATQQAVQRCALMAGLQGTPPEDIVLLRYQTSADLARYRPDMQGLPASLHGAIISRVRVAIAAMPLFATVAIRVVWMLPLVYEPWRIMRQRPEDEASRAEWAGLQVAAQCLAHQGDQPPG